MSRFARSVSFVTDPSDFDTQSPRVKKALVLAEKIHKKDFRKNGSPYIHHCIAVASLLSSLGAPEDLIVAGLLHDTVEDHPKLITLEEIEKDFGKRVRFLVDGVTKDEIMTDTMLEDFATSKKVAKTAVIDFGVALIKLTDRYHNLTTLYALKKERQKEFAAESLAFHLPLARSFGLWDFGNYIADEAFQYIDPKSYREVKKSIDTDRRLKPLFIESWKRSLAKLMRRNLVSGKITILPGGYWELSEKRKSSSMKAEVSPRGFKDITDLISFRIIVGRIGDVYRLAGAVMEEWGGKVDYRSIDDCISRPADNGYRAFHLSLADKSGVFEIAITTEAMEEYNRRGVLSSRNVKAFSQDRILVFSPKRELFFLPAGARVVDFAYKLNPVLGMQMVGARVDGRLAMPEDRLISGTQVEVVKAGSVLEIPNRKLLKICLPETAKKIELQMRMLARKKTAEKGKKLLEKVFSKFGLLSISDLDKLTELKILTAMGCEHVEQLSFKAGYSPSRYLVEVERVMDELSLTDRDLTTVAIEGKRDQKGLSVKIREILSRSGGNILRAVERVEPDGSFRIRVVIEGTTSDSELRKALSKIKHFGRIIVV